MSKEWPDECPFCGGPVSIMGYHYMVAPYCSKCKTQIQNWEGKK